MPIISSVPAIGSIVKGSPATFTLSKAQLLLVPSVAGSAYYSDTNNWQSVVLNYISSSGNQIEPVLFDATQVSPTGIFEIVSTGLNVFNIESISIVDFQQGVFRVPRSELNTSEFDVDMTPSSVTALYNSLQKGGLIVLSNSDLTATQPTLSGGSNQQVYMTPSVSSASGKKYIEYVIDANPLSNQLIVGGSISNTAPTLFEGQSSQFGFATEFYFRNDGNSIINLGSYGGASITFTASDVLMMAMDFDNNKIWLGKNGSWFAGQDPLTNTGGMDISAYTGANVYLGVSFSAASSGGQVSIETSPAYTPVGYTLV